MDFKNTNLSRIVFWNRTILTSFWLVCLLYLAGELVFLALRIRYYPEYSTMYYIRQYILLPDILLLSVLAIMEGYCKYAKKHKEEMIFFGSVLIADIILCTINPIIGGGEFVLVLPLLVAIFYTNIRMLLSALAINIATFTPMYFLSPARQENMSIYEFCVFLLILTGVTIAGYGIIKRGGDLIRYIEELAKSEEKLLIEKTLMDKLSKTDALTGLNNHITFHEYADSAIAQCDTSGMPLGMALLDIDNFKKINDTLGHRAGDTVLKKIGEIILQNITPDDFAARYGGEEFALVFAGKGIEDSLALVERIRKAIEGTAFFENGTYGDITVSAGLHIYKRGEGKESLFETVDHALYLAKHTGKNKTEVGATENGSK